MMKFRLLQRVFGGLASCFAALPMAGLTVAQQAPITIEVDVGASEGELRPVWSYFGYDEPNYTYALNGKKLLGELRQLSRAPVYIRVHNLLTTGDGSASLKWGSTNAYTEDAQGNPVYNWQIVDRIFDAFRDARITPLVELGFMPEALSTHPQPYRHDFPHGSVFTGWTYPPKDYLKWEELNYQFARHLRERYGDQELRSWLWEVWNEPDIDYWRGTRDEFFKLYDYAAAGILRALPQARIGGPDTTGAAGLKAQDYLRGFLEHCARGANAATGKIGAPLGFISFHPKGAPKWKGDHVEMGLGRQLLSVQKGFEVIAEFPEWRKTPVILGEWDPEGCAACSAKDHPENAYRNGELYAAYTAEALKDTLTLAKSTGVNLVGLLSWSFEFEDQPYFEGFRELATNGIDKPVLNTFRMLGMLGSERIKLGSSGAAPGKVVLNPGTAAVEGVDGIAAKAEREVDVLVWNYQEENLTGAAVNVAVKISGLPTSAKKAMRAEFRVDHEHSNAYTAWREMGHPQNPTPAQYSELRRAGQLQRVGPPRQEKIEQGRVDLQLELPRQGLVLLRLKW
jgi:xylan 1,4-beta-xylosidase